MLCPALRFLEKELFASPFGEVVVASHNPLRYKEEALPFLLFLDTPAYYY